MIASVTDLDGRITGAHRTWLAPDGTGKAPVDTPRRAMGDLLGHAVRFGDRRMTSWRPAKASRPSCRCDVRCPRMPMAAALSAAHLAAILFPDDAAPALYRARRRSGRRRRA